MNAFQGLKSILSSFAHLFFLKLEVAHGQSQIFKFTVSTMLKYSILPGNYGYNFNGHNNLFPVILSRFSDNQKYRFFYVNDHS